MLKVEGKTGGEVKGNEVTVEGLTGELEGAFGGGANAEDGKVLRELGEAVVGGGVG